MPSFAFGAAPVMADWNFLSNHARALLCIANDPGVRLREIGDQVGITERAAHRIVNELTDAGYLARERRGRRNHYTIAHHLPLPDRLSQSQTIGDLLEILTSRAAVSPSPRPGTPLIREAREVGI